ncbi:FAD-dependent oxidoreductase [Micromonospora sp. NPDC049523]|uniref:hydroxysqualene dehydroxylase n=1 Tax=Micromonospora sp. NPDC049523 TaxID=3155921 RepID=UPI003432E83D
MELSRGLGRLLGVHPVRVDPEGGAAGTPRVPNGTGALVVGGGIAGISAAVVLAERGVRVTVLEARPTLGGRLAAWPDALADGTAQAVDHGFHAFFRQYYNWRSILRRIDPALGFLRPVPGYPVLSADWPTEEFARLPSAPPLNLLALIARSPSLRLRDLRTMDGNAALPLLAYHPERSYAELDRVTAARLLDSLRLPDRARAMLFEVFAHSFFNHEHDMSAAELVANFHFYLLGNAEGLSFDAPDRDYDSAIWRPLAAYLRVLGGRVHTGTPVTGINRQDGGGWRVTAGGTGHRAEFLVLAVDPPALRDLLAAAPELAAEAPRLAAQVAAFTPGPPYTVARYWLAGDVAPDRAVFSGVSRQPTLDSVTLYHRLEAGARDWADRTGGAVVELHAYACAEDLPAEELAERMRAELIGLWPEVARLPVVELRARVQRQAPSFRAGSHADRPTVATDADGLFLAGDGIRADLPSALMERAAVTGILAANQILRRCGTAPEPIWSVRRRGLLAKP